MLCSKKKTDGLSADTQIRLIPPKGAKPASVAKPQIKSNSQPSIIPQKTVPVQPNVQQKQEANPIRNEVQSTNLVNMLLSQSAENLLQSTTSKSNEQENTNSATQELPTPNTASIDLEKPSVEITRQTIPVSNEKKYEEIEKQNPMVKTLKNKFNLKV